MYIRTEPPLPIYSLNSTRGFENDDIDNRGERLRKVALCRRLYRCLSKDNPRYYIATMKVFDKEGQARVERHKRMRSGKGFQTIEQPVSVEEALEKIGHPMASESTALLECMSNLVANDVFLRKL